jgi:hypothetical protein
MSFGAGLVSKQFAVFRQTVSCDFWTFLDFFGIAENVLQTSSWRG